MKTKFIEIHSLDNYSIDEIIERFQEYKRDYGGDCNFRAFIGSDSDGYGTTFDTLCMGFEEEKEEEQ